MCGQEVSLQTSACKKMGNALHTEQPFPGDSHLCPALSGTYLKLSSASVSSCGCKGYNPLSQIILCRKTEKGDRRKDDL